MDVKNREKRNVQHFLPLGCNQFHQTCALPVHSYNAPSRANIKRKKHKDEQTKWKHKGTNPTEGNNYNM